VSICFAYLLFTTDEYLSTVNAKRDHRTRLDIPNELIRFIFQLRRDVTADG